MEFSTKRIFKVEFLVYVPFGMVRYRYLNSSWNSTSIEYNDAFADKMTIVDNIGHTMNNGHRGPYYIQSTQNSMQNSNIDIWSYQMERRPKNSTLKICFVENSMRNQNIDTWSVCRQRALRYSIFPRSCSVSLFKFRFWKRVRRGNAGFRVSFAQQGSEKNVAQSKHC